MILLATIIAASTLSPAVELQSVRSAAACVVRKDRVGAADLAFTGAGSPEEASAAANLGALAKCSKGLAASRVADGVALQLYNEMVVSRTEASLSPEMAAATANRILNQADRATRGSAALECLVALRPQATDIFLKARPGSRDEQAALVALRATVPQCIPAGEQAGWSPLDFRLGLARSIYRTSPAHDMVRRGD